MTVATPFVAQVITDDDIAWACGVLKLPANAFSGPDGRDPRLSILKSGESLDVEACPGSGKTTLLVAKLAILARNWNEQRRGICVLSHTNVARREIERCLGSTAEGRKLLSYPHYVGTIVSSVLLVLTHVGMAVVLVLAGFIVVQRTFVGAGRTPALEATSSVLIILIGLWLFVRSLRGHDHHGGRTQGRFLSIAAGFVPCPLTTFIMVYALAHGMVIAGLLVTLAMAGGMVVTISAFAMTAVLFRKALFRILNRRKPLLHRASRVFETGSALAIMGAGVWLHLMR